ncbi:hypothetical protein K431DRAFT_256709 [Polychaeton citri CBS 116435]|uniref:Guanine nucleotide exchange factor n=1 Tax=Polychaeton citri CBS 116435 TaxID=1314669 RepID=A0A9P4PZW2_9PEZI|nr:hypothetical protein K431DRAFT_256709 [Polychaeton citri CBS 116435]
MLSMTPTAGTASRLDNSQATFLEVDRLLNKLQQNLNEANLSLHQQETLLTELKTHGRDPLTAGPIFSKKGIKLLCEYGLDKSSSTASREALKCLANSFLLNESTRQIFVDLGYAAKATERLKNDNQDDEFVISRILFLLTYNTELDFDVLVKKYALANTMNHHVNQHAKAYHRSPGQRKSKAINEIEDMSLVETLKLMFNVTHYHPDLVSSFTPSIEPLIDIIMHHPLPTPVLAPPISYLLNALLNLDLAACEKKTPLGPEAKSSPLFPYANPETVIDRLMSMFGTAIKTMPERELDYAAAPLCVLLQRSYPLASVHIKQFMRWVLLPKDAERDQPLGKDDSLASRLLRCSCSPNLPTLRDNISHLLFELSDRDAEKFVKNIGYGFAAGFLTSQNIQAPESAMEDSSISMKDRNTASGAATNPVTGQRLDAEEKDTQARGRVEEMTPEEKEREAERLFVLFERLKATGVMDVKNPVQQAVDEGRFEELPDE